MQGSQDSRRTKRYANTVFVLLTMLSLVTAIVVAAIVYSLLNGWALRGPTAAITGGLLVVIGVWTAAVIRGIVIGVMKKLNELDAIIETRLLGESAPENALEEPRYRNIEEPRVIHLVAGEQHAPEQAAEAPQKAEAQPAPQAEASAPEQAAEAPQKAEEEPIATPEASAPERAAEAPQRPETEPYASAAGASFGSPLEAAPQEQTEEEFSVDELPEL